jgi:hypothetical protein
MPIRPENKDRYPKNWKAISQAVRNEAGNQCEKCNAPNGVTIWRHQSEDFDGKPVYAVPCGPGAHVICAEDGEVLAVMTLDDVARLGWKPAKVVLTVAHLDHTPENCARENLRAWCQRCHNLYDAPARRAGIRERSRLHTDDLFSASRQRDGQTHHEIPGVR